MFSGLWISFGSFYQYSLIKTIIGWRGGQAGIFQGSFQLLACSKLIDIVCNIFQRGEQTRNTNQANTHRFQHLSSKAKACWRCPREEESAQILIQSLDPAPPVSGCLRSMGTPEQEAKLVLSEVGALAMEFLLLQSKLAGFVYLLVLQQSCSAGAVP